MKRLLKYDLKKGDKVGDLIFIKEVEPYIYPSGKKRRKGRFLCTCGNEFETIIQGVVYGKAKSCGCLQKKKISELFFKHGLVNHKMYSTWHKMKSRCELPSETGYENYGGKGIKVCDEWKDNFKAFYDYVTNLPDYDESKIGIRGLTLDRINGEKDYEPGNIRWVDRHVQGANKRKLKSKHGYTGVYTYKNRFASVIRYRGKDIHIGVFKTPREAAQARNEYIIKNKLFEYPIQKINKACEIEIL